MKETKRRTKRDKGSRNLWLTGILEENQDPQSETVCRDTGGLHLRAPEEGVSNSIQAEMLDTANRASPVLLWACQV